jgi:hypothetical protein
VPHRLEALGQRLEHRDERVVDDQHRVLGVVDHVSDLIGEEPDVHGVEDRAHARHGQICLQVLRRIPGEGRNSVTGSNAESLQAAAETVGPVREIAIRDRAAPAVANAHHLACGVDAAHALEDQLQRQRMVVLHQAFEHDLWIPATSRSDA